MALIYLMLRSKPRIPEKNHVTMVATVDSYTVKNWTEEQMNRLVDEIEAT